MGRFVTPQTVRLQISKGDYIDVKKRLNAREHHEHLARCMPTMNPYGTNNELQTEQVMTSLALAYIVGWSLTDDNGTPVPMNPDMTVKARLDTLGNLDQDDFKEINAAIQKHEKAEDDARAAAKNGQDGGSVSSVTSPSVNTLAGDMSGLTNSTQKFTP